MTDSGQLWLTVAYCGQLRSTADNCGILWLTLDAFGRNWMTLGQLWLILADLADLGQTIVDLD